MMFQRISKKRLLSWLGIDKNGDVTIDAKDVLPSQTNNSGKVLGTNGTAASWTTPTAAGSNVTIDTQNFELNYIGTTAQDVTGEIDGYIQDLQADKGLVKTQGGDLLETLGTKLIAGTGITLSVVTPTAVTMTDEEYANYAAFAAGESISSGERFRLTTAAIDTTDDYFAGVKGSALEANDIFEDVGGIGANYLCTQANTYQIKIALT